jgi:hypothetical protein
LSSLPSSLVRERKKEGGNEECLECGVLYACKGAHNLFTGQRERERQTDRQTERKRERVRKRERESEREGERGREWERGRKRESIYF